MLALRNYFPYKITPATKMKIKIWKYSLLQGWLLSDSPLKGEKCQWITLRRINFKSQGPLCSLRQPVHLRVIHYVFDSSTGTTKTGPFPAHLKLFMADWRVAMVYSAKSLAVCSCWMGKMSSNKTTFWNNLFLTVTNSPLFVKAKLESKFLIKGMVSIYYDNLLLTLMQQMYKLDVYCSRLLT